jgi:hypothetical protein
MQQDGELLSWYIYQFLNGLLPYVVAAIGITLVSVTPIGRAMISWLKGHINRGRAAELTGEIEHLRIELGEVQERLDYAERTLTSGPELSLPPAPRRQTPARQTPTASTPI